MSSFDRPHSPSSPAAPRQERPGVTSGGPKPDRIPKDPRCGDRPPASGCAKAGFKLAPPLVALPKRKRTPLTGLPYADLQELLERSLQREGQSAPARFRVDQLFGWLHRQRVADFEQMGNLPKTLRELLQTHTQILRLAIGDRQTSRDGTQKLRLVTPDGHSIESVLIPNAERGYTQCISSQVGCAVDCQFCATASLGLVRNLESWEIVDQVYRARDLLIAAAQQRGDRWPGRITNLVFMGMGEPLHNFNQVQRAIAVLSDERGEAISGRRITVSTSGLVPAIERFGREELGREVGLAISLNATTDPTRDAIMPINRRWNIDSLLNAVATVPPHRRRRITFEYVLLDGINDRKADAQRLQTLLGRFHCHLNVIPFNPHPHAAYRPPPRARIEAFMSHCRKGGLECYLRTPRGEDIDAACGQLALTPSPSPPSPPLEPTP